LAEGAHVARERARPGFFRTAAGTVRLHHWTKNLLVFVPIVLNHHASTAVLGKAAYAFLAFCCCASSVYIFNDFVDLRPDRRHPLKRNRPLAAGDISARAGVATAVALLSAAAALVTLLPLLTGLYLAGYCALNVAYSLYLKRQLILDVLALAGMYTIRVLAGGAATGIPISIWTLAFSLFLFLSLAQAKRYAELRAAADRRDRPADNRGYQFSDLPQLAILGSTSGYLSVLVLALYLNSPEVRTQYRFPDLLWVMCLLLLYWISRVWVLTHRGQMHEDPILFAMTDRPSHLAGLAALVLLALAWL
jgi:4-hydroxybenzoate polyprenyltransferase